MTSEFPHDPPAEAATALPARDGEIDRRRFLGMLAASAAFSNLVGCTRQPEEKILPYVRAPEHITPGEPLVYASTAPAGAHGAGVLVTSRSGRPVKIEGNPEHPASLGATDAWTQASILDLYDPERSQVVKRSGRIDTWARFAAALNVAKGRLPQDGAGLRLLTGEITSPTLIEQIETVLASRSGARWHVHEPLASAGRVDGAQRAFGEVVDARYRLEEADVVVSLDADLFHGSPGSVPLAREFARRRTPPRANDSPPMNRLYVFEPMPSVTGSMADHRVALRSSQIAQLAGAIASELGVAGDGEAASAALVEALPESLLDAIVADLRAHRGHCLVVAGDSQPARVHALVHAINDALGNAGRTVEYLEPIAAGASRDSLSELVEDMQRGDVDLLLILEGNPVYTAPADVDFAAALKEVAFSAHLSPREDETSQHCTWHIPRSHFLESWSDRRAFDGTASLVQPLIAPLYRSRSAHEVIAALEGQAEAKAYELVRATWKKRRGEESERSFEAFWKRALHDGVIDGTAAAPRPVTLREAIDQDDGGDGEAGDDPSGRGEASDGETGDDTSRSRLAELEINFRGDPSVGDGRFAGNAWLQELPRPLTKLTWTNAALLAPATAKSLGVTRGDLVTLRRRGRQVKAPVWIVPGHAEAAVTVHLGYGRTRAGSVATGLGFDAYRLRTSDAPWFAAGARIEPTGEHRPLACTQPHHAMDGHDAARSVDVGEFDFTKNEGDDLPTLYPPVPASSTAESPQWGMAIDLGACNGCNACVVACQAENNIPVVGENEVLLGREMHWIRVDSHAAGTTGDGAAVEQQPVLCMHCENAPCEPVCPVGATVHSSDGLNDMVYNRCVGTRYCSNNCPYKVRRFNFRDYIDQRTSLEPLRNPEVTVRSRGVMEKCTYCVQRIRDARIEAKKAGRPVADGEVVTACQAVCPTEAIVFGDVSDPDSRVSQAKRDPRDYGLLAELGTRPRTSYLTRLRNPHPEVGEGR